jgi:hypothetical protein
MNKGQCNQSIEYGNWTIEQLKEELKSRKAKTSGRKHELVERYVITINVLLAQHFTLQESLGMSCDFLLVFCTASVNHTHKFKF